MPGKIFITAHAAINNNTVCKNGVKSFENKEADATAFLTEVYHHFDYKYPRFHKMDNLSKLGWLTTELLLQDNFVPGKYPPESVGVIFTNSSASLDVDIKYFATTKEFASPSLFVYTLPNVVIGEICIKHKFKGENAFFIFEAFDAVFLEKYVSNLINNNNLQAVICGWVEWLGEDYQSVLFLVEKEQGEGENNAAGEIGSAAKMFTSENLNQLYQLNNG